MESKFKEQSYKSRNTRVIFLAVLLAISFRNMGLSIIDIGLPNFILNLSGSLISFGLIIGIYSITQSFFQFPFAAISDRYGRKIVILIGMIIYAFGTFLCFLAQDIIQLIIFRAIQGIGAYTSILQAIIGDIFKSEHHGEGMGYYSLALNIGYFAGIIIGGYLSSFLGFRSIFLINVILIVISGIFLFCVYKDKEGSKLKQTSNKVIKSSNLLLNRETLFNLLKKKQYFITIFLNSIRWFIFGGIVIYLIWVLQVYFEVGQIISSYILILIVAVYLLFIIISTKIIDKYGPRKMMLIGQIIALILIMPFIFQLTNILGIFIIVSSLMGMGLALYGPAGNTLLLKNIEKINPKLKGSGIGLNNAIGFFSSSLSPMIISPLGEIYIFFPFYLLFGLILLAFIITIKFVH